MHAQPTATDPRVLRWVVAETLPTGRLRDAPGDLGELLRRGCIASATSEPHGIVIALRPPFTWASEGEQVRRALTAAIPQTEQWELTGDEDAILAEITKDILAGPVGDFVRGHGGEIRVVEAHDAVVVVALDGACRGCGAAGQTLHQRLDGAIRERYPALREVREEQPARVRGLWPRLRAARGDHSPHGDSVT